MSGKLKFLLYLGCTIPTKQYAYEVSARNVLPRLGVELVEFEGSHCCGFPLKGINKKAWIYLSARLLALASKTGLPVLSLCNGCDVSLRKVKHMLEEDEELRAEIAEMLREEGLELNTNVELYHTIDVLHDIVGVEKIKSMVVKPLNGLKIASHPGCHVIRPTDVPRPEDPKNPVKIDEILEAIGASSGDYPDKGGCCGATMLPFVTDAAIKVGASKLKIIAESGFEAVTTSCPYCMEMLDSKQDVARSITGESSISIPVFYLTQLVGLALGMKPEELGLSLNMSPIDKVLEKLGV